MTDDQKEAFRLGFLAGFAASGEGFNGEYSASEDFRSDPEVLKALSKALAEADLK